ncbi:MAG: hypothetical protein WDM92_04035 [Caulobacteraceae bacterium]
MKRSESRILTTHVGSLPRPKAMLDMANYRTGPTDQPEKLRPAPEGVGGRDRQEAGRVGLDIISDGEFGKESWAGYIIKRLSGFEVRPEQRREVEWLGQRPLPLPRIPGRGLPPGRRGHRHGGLRRPDPLPGPRQHRPRHRGVQGGPAGREGRGGVHDGRGAGLHRL